MSPEDLARYEPEIATAPREELPAISGALARLQAAVLARLSSPPTPARDVDEDRLIDMAEVAQRLGVKVELAREMGRRGEIPIVHVGDRLIRVRESALVNWIKARETGTLARGRR